MWSHFIYKCNDKKQSVGSYFIDHKTANIIY